MKIRTQFTVATIFFCIIFILIGTSLLYTNNEINRLAGQEETARDIVRGSYELSYLSNDYLFHPDEQRQNIQWNFRFAVLSGDIARLSVDTPEQQMLVDRITTNKERLHEVYSQSVSAIEASKSTPGQQPDPELIQVAWSRFIVQNQAMIFDASHLAQLIQEESDRVRYLNTILILLLLSTLLIFLVTNYLLIKRRILESIAELNKGTQVIGRGDLDFRLGALQDDEIGELSLAFDRMTENLRLVTASKADLEHEVTERRKAEDALREARDNLEIQVQNRTILLAGANRDLRLEIAERKRAEEALRESEEKYRNIFENAVIGVYQTASDGHLLNANRAFARMYGYESREEMLAEIPNVGLQLYAHPEDRRKLLRLLDKQGMIENYELPVLRKDHSQFWVSLTARMVRDPGGTLLWYEGTQVDITDKKKAEQTIQNSLEEKIILLREVHHRVKNNLAGIISLIDLQRSQMSDTTTVTQMNDLESRIRSMALIHESLYKIGNLAEIGFQAYCTDLVSHLAQTYSSPAKIHWIIEMEEVRLPLDTAIPCGMIISEIVTNSLKYAFPTTFPCAERRGEPCTILLKMERTEQGIILTIADNGVGIPPATDHRQSKTLGLYLIHLMAEKQLQGTVALDCSQGTRYSITFTPQDRHRPG